jgi:hypothetical protein
MCLLKGMYRVDWCSDNALDSYSGDARFKSRPEHRISYWYFPWFSSAHPGKCWDSTLVRQWPFPSKSFPIHHLSYNSKPYSPATDSFVIYTWISHRKQNYEVYIIQDALWLYVKTSGSDFLRPFWIQNVISMWLLFSTAS